MKLDASGNQVFDKRVVIAALGTIPCRFKQTMPTEYEDSNIS